MSNIRELRPNNKYVVGDMVNIGNGLDKYEVVGFGKCHECIETGVLGEGHLQNGHEFLRLGVTGHEWGQIEIHCDFVTEVGCD